MKQQTKSLEFKAQQLITNTDAEATDHQLS